jgi:hypothetical protein
MNKLFSWFEIAVRDQASAFSENLFAASPELFRDGSPAIPAGRHQSAEYLLQRIPGCQRLITMQRVSRGPTGSAFASAPTQVLIN